MRRNHKLYWLISGIVIVLSALILFLFRTESVSYDEAFKKVKAVSVYFDDQNEFMHQNPSFHDDEINNLNDLMSLSDLIVLGEVKEIEQVNDFCFVTVGIKECYKGVEKTIRLIYPNCIIANQYDRDKGNRLDLNEKVTMSQNIPVVLKEKEKYLMFLNQVGNQDLYESSSSSYSIIPVKDEIHILKINRKTNDPINLDDEIENYDLIFVSEKDIVESVMSVMEECYKGILNRESPKLLIDD